MLSWRFWAVMITSSSATLRVSSTWARVGVAASTATATRLRRKSRLAVGSLSCEYTMFSPTCNEMDARPHLHGVLLLWIPCPGCPAVVDIPPIEQGWKLRVHGHLECTACGGDGGGKTNTLQGVSSSAQSLPAAPGWRLFARGVDWPEHCGANHAPCQSAPRPPRQHPQPDPWLCALGVRLHGAPPVLLRQAGDRHPVAVHLWPAGRGLAGGCAADSPHESAG